jgi:hypothetical protein
MKSPSKSTNPVTLGIYTALVGRDLNCANRFISLYEEPKSSDIHDHIAAANRFWRDQLGSCPFDTMKERLCLVDKIELRTWLNYFAVDVVPTIISASLPSSGHEPRTFFEKAASPRWGVEVFTGEDREHSL